MARVGVREVAARANVSLGTVSHYLNQPERVSPAKRARIQAAIDELGFVRNNAAGQLRNGRSALIGYLAPEVSTPYFAVIAEGVERRAAAAGYSLFIASTHGDPDREFDYLDMFEQNRVQGMLVASRGEVEDRLAQIRERGIPSVLVGTHARSEDQPSVTVDDVHGGELVGRHLLETGRRRIAFVGGPFSIRNVTERFMGLTQAVRGTAAVEVIDTVDRTIAEGNAIGRALAERAPELRPDAVFTVNDLLALGIMQALVDHGIRVPEQVAIVGYDDVPFAESSLIPLSSVRATHAEYGEAAFELLLAEIRRAELDEEAALAAEPPGHLVFQPRLRVRASSAGAPE